MALLSRPLALHNVDDVERFAARILERRRLDWLLPHERDDLLTFLVEVTWELSERFEPRGYAFSQWARPTLERRTVDWLRATFGRTRWKFAASEYERERPELVSLDADDSDQLDGLAAAFTGRSLDDGEHRLADELRSLQARSRRPGGRNGHLG